MIWEIIGAVASAMIIISFFPQIIKAYKTKRLADLSYLFPIFLLIAQSLWIAYGIHISDVPIIATNMGAAGCSITLIAMKYVYSRRS